MSTIELQINKGNCDLFFSNSEKKTSMNAEMASVPSCCYKLVRLCVKLVWNKDYDNFHVGMHSLLFLRLTFLLSNKNGIEKKLKRSHLKGQIICQMLKYAHKTYSFQAEKKACCPN